MGCYDSSLLRPLLSGSSSSQNNDSNRNNRTSKRRADYDGMTDDDEDPCKVTFKQKRRNLNLELIMTVIHKISLLVWKNLLLRKRHYIVTTLEILLPTLFALILVYGRSQATKNSPVSSSAASIFSTEPQADLFPRYTEQDFKISCGNYADRCMVAYAPNNTDTNDIITKLSLSGGVTNIDWKAFDSESDIEKFIASLSFNEITGGNETLRAAIVFEDFKTAGGIVSYKIRMMGNSLEFPREVMSSLFPWLQLPGPDYSNKDRYKDAGFTAFQLNLDKVLIKKLTNKEITHTLSMQAFPYPPYERNLNFSEFYFIVLPNVIALGFIFIVPSIIRGVVNERETGIKELMKLSGIPNWMHWFAWMINSMIFLTISVTIVIVLFFSAFMNPGAGAILTNSDPTVWWLVLFLYVLSSTSFCFFVSSFFQRPTIAITVGIILWLTTYYAPSVPLGDSNRYQTLALSEKLSAALLPNMALYWALKVMCAFEGKASGAQWKNLFEPLSTVDTLTLGHIMLMFVIDAALYLCLTLYVEAVLPSQYGIRKPWYFIFKPSMWGMGRKGHSVSIEDMDSSIINGNQGKASCEAEPEGLRAGVEIRNLHKVFGRNKVAVGGVSMKMYDGEIFALLGHNGAGKTTTISCCIGMIAPSKGTAIINGYDIRTEMDQVREHLGLCPQHNLLFDELTVDEHLLFFGRLKGLSSNEAKNERVELLRKLQLTDKTNTMARALSGGQKRKLCLGISLVGRAKVVFLDEPTSGMDVEARRAIWDLLLEERGQRTIILTTHFMEEADVLGDRIGIMAHGKLQCCGTSMFLKKFYGTGYTLNLTIEDETKKDSILAVVQSHVPNASLKEEELGNNLNELTIVIPTESSSTGIFPPMFKELQCNKSLGIKTVGFSVTTMDEVFVKAGEESSYNNGELPKLSEMTNLASLPETTVLYNRDNHNCSGAIESNAKNSKEKLAERLPGLHLLRQQFCGLIVKRCTYTLRKWVLVLTQVAIPVFILIIAILAGNTQLQPPKSPTALKIALTSYKSPITLYTSTEEELGKSFAFATGPSATVYTGNETGGLLYGLLKIGETDLASYRERHIVAAEMTSTHINTMYSTIPFHTSPLALNLASNTLLHTMNPNEPTSKISVTNHPLQGGFDYLLQALQPDPAFSVSNALMFGALAPIGLALLAASFIVSPLEEKLCKGKQLQLMTGVNPIVYWGSSFIWDYFVMILVIIVMVLCFPIFQKADTYTTYGGGGAFFLILFVYGYAAIPFSYVCSLFAGTVPGGFSFVTIIHIGTGMLLPFVVYVLEATPVLAGIANTIRLFARFFPTFSASISTMRFVEIALKNSRCNLLPDYAESLLCDPSVTLQPHYRQCCQNCDIFPGATCIQPVPYLSWTYKRGSLASLGTEEGVPGIGQELLFLFLLGIAYQIILILLEYGFIERIAGIIFRTKSSAFQNSPDDIDVINESERVHELVKAGDRINEDALVVENLCKSYGSFAAVSNLSFGVHHGECFGLLGVNGAGKTTTFRMLTGDEVRSNGNAFAMMRNLETDRKPFLANMGYCPQFDGIVGVLTGREMVELFGRLRGVKHIRKESDKWLARVGLTESRDVQCRKYSGGMKRRLSAAMAMVGDPEIVLLDEPTTGVDPVSRREFWKIISSIRESGRAIILTSHSMDEITACCSRLGIMVNGQLQCLGSVQHLKNKFAQGYSLSIKLKSMVSTDDDELQALEQAIFSRFTPCSLKDKHQTALQYQINNASLPWEFLFRTMEDIKSQFENIIEEYSITETTLEEVFLSFARKQYSNRQANISLIKKLLTCQCCQ